MKNAQKFNRNIAGDDYCLINSFDLEPEPSSLPVIPVGNKGGDLNNKKTWHHKHLGISSLHAQLWKKLAGLFKLEEVEVTFENNNDQSGYTYKVLRGR